jgi:hypothetical protein
MYLSGSSRQCIAAGLVGGEGFAFVPRRGRCVDDFVTFHRQRPERRIVAQRFILVPTQSQQNQ